MASLLVLLSDTGARYCLRVGHDFGAGYGNQDGNGDGNNDGNNYSQVKYGSGSGSGDGIGGAVGCGVWFYIAEIDIAAGFGFLTGGGNSRK
jgi:hypothetical protein